MALTAKRWQTRPSLLLSVRDDVMGFLLDESLALRLVAQELQATSARDAKAKLPVGLRYASEADYDDPLPARAA